MFRAATQEHTPRPLIYALLTVHEAQVLSVEGLRRVDVSHEQPDGADLGDLERLRQQHTLDIVSGGQRFLIAVTGEDVDPFAARLSHFGALGHLRQERFLAKAPVVHLDRLTDAVPTDLLDAIVELVRMTVWVIDIDMPIAPWHIASDTLNRHLLPLEIAVRLHDLFEDAALPSDLIDGDLGAEAPVSSEVHHLLVEQDERVMICPIPHEIAARIPQGRTILGHPRSFGKVERIRGLEAE